VTAALVVLATLTVSTGFAQDKVKANVPFAFEAGKVLLPAGIYTVSELGNDAVVIRSRESGAAVTTQYYNEEKLRAQSPKMVFHKCGDSYFLAEIWDGSGNAGMELPESKRERELQASNHGASHDELVIVAMK
jgi:hypothetical protein